MLALVLQCSGRLATCNFSENDLTAKFARVSTSLKLPSIRHCDSLKYLFSPHPHLAMTKHRAISASHTQQKMMSNVCNLPGVFFVPVFILKTLYTICCGV